MSRDFEKRQKEHLPTQMSILQRLIKKLWRQIVNKVWDRVPLTTQVGRSLALKNKWTTRLGEIVSKVWDRVPVVI
jgi:hypothetical protein